MRAPIGYLRKPQAADRLAVTLRTLDNWMKRGIIKSHKVGRSVYFKESELFEAFGERSSMVEPSAYNRQVDSSSLSAPTKAQCQHRDTIDLPESIFVWCKQCGSVKRKSNDPTVKWIHHSRCPA